MDKKLVDKLIPDINLKTIDEIEKLYPPRNLPEGAMVTRIAPSPTGFIHIGNIYMSMVNAKIAHQSGGKFIVRIENTDTKREVEGAKELAIKSFDNFNITVDESPNLDGSSKGNYGPYVQSERKDLYKAYIKDLLEKDLAYPCFCTSEQLEEVREGQKKEDLRTGYYGNFARCRRLSEKDIEDKLNDNQPYIIRFRSEGRHSNKVLINDLIKGKRNLSENDFDIVIMKTDGLPTYHFAVLIDDHLMGITHILRGDEWLSSLTLHLQLFEAMGWKVPAYAHLAPIEKMDDGSRRKLSKRKDPEANVIYYDEQGYPKEAVLEYLMNLANSDFEPWRKQNPTLPLEDFDLKINKLNKSGALFDFDKLNHVSQNYISRLKAEEVFDQLHKWAFTNNNEKLAHKMDVNKKYITEIINIERENTNKPRKDITMWSQAWDSIGYFFDDEFHLTKEEALELLENAETNNITSDFLTDYDKNIALDKQEWFEAFKVMAIKHGYATNGKEYKANPEAYKGMMGDFAKIFRVLLKGSAQTPDLYYMMKVMGKDRVEKRLSLLN